MNVPLQEARDMPVYLKNIVKREMNIIAKEINNG
jgi:hypothetical protein